MNHREVKAFEWRAVPRSLKAVKPFICQIGAEIMQLNQWACALTRNNELFKCWVEEYWASKKCVQL